MIRCKGDDFYKKESHLGTGMVNFGSISQKNSRNSENSERAHFCARVSVTANGKLSNMLKWYIAV